VSCPEEKKRYRAMLDVFQDLYGPLKVPESKGTELERIKALPRSVLDFVPYRPLTGDAAELLKEINDELS
jgi:hypothetical protein